MKKYILIISFLFISCIDNIDYKISKTEYKSYIVSSKKENSSGDGYIYIQTPISTERVRLNYNNFRKIRERDTIMILTRYLRENE